MSLVDTIKEHLLNNKGKYLTLGTLTAGAFYFRHKIKTSPTVKTTKRVWSFYKTMKKEGDLTSSKDVALLFSMMQGLTIKPRQLTYLKNSLCLSELTRTNFLVSITQDYSHLLGPREEEAKKIFDSYKHSDYYFEPDSQGIISRRSIDDMKLAFKTLAYFSEDMTYITDSWLWKFVNSQEDEKQIKTLKENYFENVLMTSVMVAANNVHVLDPLTELYKEKNKNVDLN